MNAETTPVPAEDFAGQHADSPRIAAPEGDAPGRHRRLRYLLLLAGPVAVLAGGFLLWFGTGRYAGTEDAYVKADKVMISAQVAGPIVEVVVQENQPVRAGDVLFRIDERPYRIALAGAEAQLVVIATELDGIKASLRQQTEELRLAHTRRDFAAREFDRQSELARRKLVSTALVDEFRYKLDVARRQIRVTEQARAQYLSRLHGKPDLLLEQYPAYQAARASRDASALDLEYTVIRAPFAGIVGKIPQPGQFVTAGSAVMSLVKNDEVWIEANYKETDLAHVRVGQPVAVEIDAYPDHRWQGRVQSISQATGAEFSVLPPQNASGNWVKIVQRIPVRIAIEPRVDDPPLRAGMTATVEIDTGDHRGSKALPGDLVSTTRDDAASGTEGTADPAS